MTNFFKIFNVKNEQTKNANNPEINLDHNDKLVNLKKVNDETSDLGNMLSGPVRPILKNIKINRYSNLKIIYAYCLCRQ